MRFAAFALSAAGGLFGLWLWLPTVVAVFGGTETGPVCSPTLRVLALVALLASMLALAGAVMSARRSPRAWMVLVVSAAGMLVGLGWVYFVGVPSAVALSVAALLAYRSRPA